MLFALLLAQVGLVVGGREAKAQPITSATIDGTNYDPVVHYNWGIGALTQGGQQRLIYDYPEPQRTELLDYLFCTPMVTPTSGYCTGTGAGAAFQTLKVELGGDGFEAEGAEPSYAHTLAEMNAAPTTCHYRGYEWWLMKQAKLRNPNMTFFALPWGIPGWVGGTGDRTTIYTAQGATYVVKFLQCAKNAGLDFAYVGPLNEDSYSTTQRNWIVNNLQPSIAAATNPALTTTIVCCDLDYDPWRRQMDITTRCDPGTPPLCGQNDTALRAAVDKLSSHYPAGSTANQQAFTVQFNKPLWDTEESVSGDLAFASPPKTTRLIGELYGALYQADNIMANYQEGGITHHDVIFYLNGFYDTLYARGAGFISSNNPSAGHFDVQPGLWTFAHINQFSSPGWHFLNGQAYGCFDPSFCGDRTNGWSQGRYQTLSDGSNYSIFAATGQATQSYTVTFTITGGLSSGQVHLWKTDASGSFVQQTDPTMSSNTFTVTFQPNAMYTISTLSGRSKLSAGTNSNQAFFPGTYSDNFSGYTVGDNDPGNTSQRNIAKYLSTMEGSFDLTPSATCGNGSQCLQQNATSESKRQFGTAGEQPYAMIGEDNWTNYQVQVDIAFPSGALTTDYGSVEGRFEPVMDEANDFNRHGAYDLEVQRNGTWTLYKHYVDSTLTYTKTSLATGSVSGLGTTWHTIKLKFTGHVITGYINNVTNPVVTYTDTSSTALATGMAGIGSGWNVVKFENLSISQNDNSANQVDDQTTGTGTRQFDYHGTWTSCSPCNSLDLDYQNSITSSSTNGDYLLFRYTGSRAILFGTKAQNGGQAMVSVLDSTCTTVLDAEVQVDWFHEARAVGQQVMFASPLRSSGSYCLKVRVLGTGQPGQTDIGGGINNVHIDRIDVD